MTQTTDLAVIGGGIVGLGTALALTEAHPRLRLVLLDKEPQLGSHQTGHNSGRHPLRRLLQARLAQGEALRGRARAA